MNYENTFKNNNIEIRCIAEIDALDIIFRNHYSKIMPRLTKYFLDGFINGKCVGVVTCGYGTRPLHTIKKLFPSLKTKDYFEIGKMCMEESMPKNTESAFLSKIIKWLKIHEPNRKILFTWADGILGKIGTVYMSSNFLFGGYIWTDLYITDKGEKVHPRTSQGLTDKGDKICGHRPTKKYMIDNGWSHYKGKQFRYIYFLCNKKEKKRLLSESAEKWGIDYPKTCDILWEKQDLITGDWLSVPKMFYDQTVTTRANKKAVSNKSKIVGLKKAREFFDI